MQIKEDRVEHYGESSQKEQNKDAVKDKSVIIIYDNKGKVDFIFKVESIFCLRFS